MTARSIFVNLRRFPSSLSSTPISATTTTIPTTSLCSQLRFGLSVQSIIARNRRNYHAKVIDHYENPRNIGSLPASDPSVGTGLVGAPACGDVMKLSIKVDENDKIIEAKFKTFGCGSAIASSSYVTTMLNGKTLDEATQIRNTQIAKELSLPPVKHHCSMLAEDAVKAAIRDFRKKKQVKQQSK